MHFEFAIGFFWGVVGTIAFIITIFVLDSKEKEWKEFQQFKKSKPTVVDATFVTKPSSQALARQRNSVPRIHRSTEIIGR